MDSARGRLEVVRGLGRVVATGTLDELVALARRGKLRTHDGIVGLNPDGPVPIQALPELAPLVPSWAEHRAARSLRALLLFDAVAGPLFVIRVARVTTDQGGHPLPGMLFPLVLFIAFFGLPLIPLWRRYRKLRALRLAGGAGGIAAPMPEFAPSTGRARSPETEPETEDDPFRTLVTRRTPATWFLVAAMVAVFGVSLLLPDHWLLLRFGKNNERIAQGELWRLLTPIFLHGGLLHLFFNATALAEFGRVAESLFGWRRFLLAFLLSGIMGCVASFLATPGWSVGASGGIFGLMGLLLVFGFRHRTALPAAARKRFTTEIGTCIAVNVLLGLTSTFIDNAGHIGGLLTGLALGLVLRVDRGAATLLGRRAAPGPAGAV